MTQWRLTALALLLVTLALFAAISAPPLSAQNNTPQATSVASHPDLGPLHPPSLRTHLIEWLTKPDVAVLVLGAGVLLLFLECNLPGAILPGALGLLLALSALFGLHLLPLRPLAIVAVLAGSTLLAVSAHLPLFGAPAVAGTAGLVFGLCTLVLPSANLRGVHPAVGGAVGLTLGVAASVLGRIAARARRNKAILAAGSSAPRELTSPSPPGASNHGLPE